MEDQKLSELTEAQAKADGEKKKSIHFSGGCSESRSA